jgi:hypothetical protein
MHAPSRRIRTIGATGIVAAAVLATGSPASTKTPTSTQPVNAKQIAQLVQLQSDQDGGGTYVWMVNGVQRGLAFR